MKSTMKLFLLVILFSSVVFAEEGNMGSGTKACPSGQTSCPVAPPTTGDEETNPGEPTDSTGSILIVVREYFDSMVEYFQN